MLDVADSWGLRGWGWRGRVSGCGWVERGVRGWVGGCSERVGGDRG